MKIQYQIALLLLIIVGLASCLKPKTYPLVPKIKFESFEKINQDSAMLTISFTDGDGNIGLNEGDTFPPYDTLPWSMNLFLDYYEKENGVWVEKDTKFEFNYRVPDITPEGQNKALKGEISINLAPFYFDPSTSNDTLKYKIKLVDRDLNESNIVDSGPILKE